MPARASSTPCGPSAGVMPVKWNSFFLPVRTMTATIASEMGEVASGSGTKYVDKVETSDKGVITVTSQSLTKAPDLKDAAGKTITLTPYKDATIPLANTDVAVTIHHWECKPGTTDGMPAKYLPGSCK